MQTEEYKPNIVEQIIYRIICAVIAFFSLKLLLFISSKIVGDIASKGIFSNGDPFVLVLFPFVLGLVLITIAAVFVLAWITFISVAYAIYPPFATWVMSKIK